MLVALLTANVTVISGEEAVKTSIPPNDAVQEEVNTLIATIYKSDFASAKTAEQKLVFARKLLRDGLASKDDPNGKFVLLRLAREIAIEQGELELALLAAHETGAAFQVDSLQLKMDT